jgi:hypothetical protein
MKFISTSGSGFACGYCGCICFYGKIALQTLEYPRYTQGVGSMAIQDEVINYMESLGSSFQPEKAQGIEATIQIHFLDPMIGEWFVDIRDNRCDVQRGTKESPSITVRVDPKIFLDIQSGKIMANMAVSRGKMQLTGDLSLAFKIGPVFNLPRGMKFQLL